MSFVAKFIIQPLKLQSIRPKKHTRIIQNKSYPTNNMTYESVAIEEIMSLLHVGVS